jgi:hypothetical protein
MRQSNLVELNTGGGVGMRKSNLIELAVLGNGGDVVVLERMLYLT